jgi:succinate dehydrogenase / fumarate reductase cytochrome b subunit
LESIGGQLFEVTHVFIRSPSGMVLLFLWSAAFSYQLCNGIRHLAWDAGYGFEQPVQSSSAGGSLP